MYFNHFIKEKSVFAPPYACVTEELKVFWYSHKEFVVEVSLKMDKIPYCDYFIVRKQWVVKQID